MSFIDSYVNGCIPPLMNTPASTSSNCCVPSPITFTYNYYTSNIMFNYLGNNPTSPKPGVSATAIYQLQSTDSFLKGIDLTLSGIIDIAAQDPTITTQLYINNSTVTASDKNGNTLGAMNFQLIYANPLRKGNEPEIEVRLPQLSSNVSSACGIFSSYAGGKIVINVDNNTFNRTILLYRG